MIRQVISKVKGCVAPRWDDSIAFYHQKMRQSTNGANNAAAGGRSSCPFTTLGISQNSSREAVKAAYRASCQTEHPDVGGNEENFRIIHDAYEECIRRVQQREADGRGGCAHAQSYETSSAAAENSMGEDDKRRHQQQSCDWYKMRAACFREQRLAFYGAFPSAKTEEEIEKLFFAALRGHCFDTIDVAEPLTLALRHYHLVTGYGAPHLRRCFGAIDSWEKYTGRSAGATTYHILLQLYTDGPKPGLTATIIAESVEAVMEQMSAKGVEYDDWTLTLAHKAYRTSPYPT